MPRIGGHEGRRRIEGLALARQVRIMRRMLILLALLLWPATAPAKVTLTFYSRELGVYFPHAFVRITGATDAEPDKQHDENYGFTAKSVTPAVLMGPVAGEILAAGPGYVRHSDSHLSLVLTDDQYAAVLAVVEKWRTLPQPSYDLHKANCVFFVGDVARALGMVVDDGNAKLMSRPRSYIINLVRLNPGVGTITPGGRAERALAR
jgi:hypothetical protein